MNELTLPGEFLPALKHEGSYPYDDLPPKLAKAGKEAQAAAARIKKRNGEHVGLLLETGKDLAAVKKGLGHGKFGAWLKAEFDWTERTAERYMSVARAFVGKTDTVSVLKPVALYRLAAKSTPQTVRDRVFEKLDNGEIPDKRRIEGMIQKSLHETEAAKLKTIDWDRRDAIQRRIRRRDDAKITREAAENETKARRTKVTDALAALLIERMGSLPDEIRSDLHLVRAADLTKLLLDGLV